jgi:hypothetical protein
MGNGHGGKGDESGKEFRKFGLKKPLGKLYPIKKVEEAMAWKHPILNECGVLGDPETSRVAVPKCDNSRRLREGFISEKQRAQENHGKSC